jgi:hypothetical protein
MLLHFTLLLAGAKAASIFPNHQVSNDPAIAWDPLNNNLPIDLPAIIPIPAKVTIDSSTTTPTSSSALTIAVGNKPACFTTIPPRE